MKITLKNIADDTGLSIATVSRALNRKKRRYTLNEEKIYAAARKLGYPYIESLDKNKKLTVALVAEIHQEEFYSSLLYGFFSASKLSKINIVYINVGVDKSSIVNHIITLSEKYNGICLFLPNLEKEQYKQIKEGVGEYAILSLMPGKNNKIDTVSFDSYNGGYIVAKHFEEVGFTNFGIITGPKKAMDATFRKNGFLDHINESRNLKLVWSFEGDFTYESGERAFENFKQKGLKNIAIFGCNDHICFGFMKSAKENGYKIPDDFIISGYDNISFCKTITPELTTVSTDFAALALKALRIIKSMINDKNDIIGQVSMIPVRMIIRKSTGVKQV